MRIVMSVLLCLMTFCGPSVSHETSDSSDSQPSSQVSKQTEDDNLAWFICRMWKRHKLRVEETSYQARVTGVFLYRAIKKNFDTTQFAAHANSRNIFSLKGPSSTSTNCDPLMQLGFGKDCDSIELETVEFVDAFKQYELALRLRTDKPTSENLERFAEVKRALNLSIGKADIDELSRILNAPRAEKVK